jgi:hypothetical protein
MVVVVVGHPIAPQLFLKAVTEAVVMEHLVQLTLLVEFQEMALMVEAVEAVEPTDMELQELPQLEGTAEMAWSLLGTSQASHKE